ncbi:MAG TPA: EAL domain-containing protein [Steroidobacteraceae bacterium]|nr:EAL domain-containing protein [Steroidobacteraceae bacterium]
MALLLLAATVLYLVAMGGAQLWANARTSLLDLAVDLEAAITGGLDQTAQNLRGLGNEIGAPGESTADLTSALGRIARFDANVAFLGIARPDGSLIMVDRGGQTVAADVATAVRPLLLAQGTGVVIEQLIQLPHARDWYLPLKLNLARPGREPDVVLALVPVKRLTGESGSLSFVKDSWITVVTTAGVRLFSYSKNLDQLEVNGPPIPAGILDPQRGRATGNFKARGPVDGVLYEVGFARSDSLKLYVASTVSEESLYRTWLSQSLPAVVVFLLGLAAVATFRVQLYAALRRQQLYVSQQEYRAKHDALTGLLNREGFMQLLEQAIAHCDQESIAVVLLDLNRFKDINDTLGHAAGDQVLEDVGKRLEALLRDEDIHVARLGGDELALIVKEAADNGALELTCARVQAALGHTIRVRSVEINLAASMGAALYPQDARTASELLRCADIAMYEAKHELRPYSRYSQAMDNFTPDMLALQSEFANALHQGDVTVDYQPKIRLGDGALVGLEALARWSHPTRGSVPPAQFIYLVEGTELIHPFTLYILNVVARQMALWIAAGRSISVSVNISANNLLDNSFIDRLSEVLRASGVPAQLLELEITESAVIRHPETILRRLQQIRDLGVTLSIDDFGTGYTSLSYLKQLPVQQLKIDKTFIMNLTSDSADQRIVRSAIQLAHGFGMTVVAEGVESEAVASQLLEYGCDYAQGYHLGRPQGAVSIETNWLTRRATRELSDATA